MSDDTFDVKQLGKDVADVAKGFEAYKETNDAILKEMSEKGAVDPLLEEKLTKIEASMTKSQERLDAYELSQKRQARVVTDPDGNSVDLDAKALHWAQDIAKKRGTMINDFGADKLDEYKAAFESYMRGDERKMNAEEFKSLSVGADPDGDAAKRSFSKGSD